MEGLDHADAYSHESSPFLEVESHTLRPREVSSCSSAWLVTDPEDGMSFIDIHTKKQIDFDHAKYPSLHPETQSVIVNQYRLVKRRIQAEKLYDCNYLAYAAESFRYVSLFFAMIIFLRMGWYAISAVFLGVFWHQLVFTVHDAGHMGITHNYQIDTMIGILIADFIGGLSLCWWKHNHTVHHIVTNSPEHDPDIEHVPFFAVSPRFFKSRKSTFYDRVMIYDAFARVVLPYQAYLYYPTTAVRKILRRVIDTHKSTS